MKNTKANRAEFFEGRGDWRGFFDDLEIPGFSIDDLKVLAKELQGREKSGESPLEPWRVSRSKVQKRAITAGGSAGKGEGTRAQQLFQGQKSSKKMRNIPILDQWVEVRVADGQTKTTLYPSNEQLIEEGKAMDAPPELVYRRMHFPDGVPAEYHWAVSDERARQYGGCGIQRMTVDTWLTVIEKEKTRGDGHVGPTGVGNLPRPKERGGCECPVCVRAQERLDKEAA